MKTCLSFLLMFFCLVQLQFAQGDFLGLKDIDHGHGSFSYYESDTRPVTSIEVNSLGGSVESFLKLDDGCTEKYKFSWTFDQDVSSISVGETLTGSITGTKLSGDCYNNTAQIGISGSNTGSTLKEPKLPAESGINVSGSGVHATGYDHLPKTKTFTIKISSSSVPDASFFTLRISTTTDASNDDVFDYEVRYVYEKNYQAKGESQPFNCHALYDLGVNIGMIEYASLKNDSPAFVVGFIENAIKVINSLGCLDSAYLLDLKARMSKASESNSFYGEISNYRQNLPSLIKEDCN